MHRQLTGVALVARRANQPQRDVGETALVAYVHDLPVALVEPDRSAVQRVGLVVERQLVGLAVEGEAAAARYDWRSGRLSDPNSWDARRSFARRHSRASHRRCARTGRAPFSACSVAPKVMMRALTPLAPVRTTEFDRSAVGQDSERLASRGRGIRRCCDRSGRNHRDYSPSESRHHFPLT